MLPTPIQPIRGRSLADLTANVVFDHGNDAAAADDARKERRVCCERVTKGLFAAVPQDGIRALTEASDYSTGTEKHESETG